MMSFNPDFADMFVVLTLIMTMISLFAVTAWSFGPGRFKPADEVKNKHRRER